MDYIRLSQCSLKDNINNRIPLIFMIKSVEIKQYQKGNGEFMSLVLKDKETETEAKIWTVTQDIINRVKPGLVYEGLIDIKPYEKGKDGLSCIIYSLEVSNRFEVKDFVDWDTHSDAAIETIKNALNVIQGTVYGDIASKILNDKWDKFKVWTAGKNVHHNQLGALAVHTANVTKIALKIGQYYNNLYGNIINLNLLIAGCILHDTGKMVELDVNIESGKVEYSTNSVLQNHLISGLLEIERTANSLGIDTRENESIKLLQHMIAAHHGLIEWGSLMTPSIPEAVILHNADAIDAELWRFDSTFKNIHGGTYDTVWMGGKAKNIYKEISKDVNN